jgi:hypothetical protein
MLIDRFLREYDHTEIHRIEIDAPPDVVYDAVWRTDIGSSLVVRGLLALRSVPKLLTGAPLPARASFRLETLLGAGFGLLAEEKGKEVVLGVNGRFWRPVDNLLPFDRDDFDRPVPAGTARGVWNFSTTEVRPGRTELTTETRVACGDDASRRKFAAYWTFVRPFSGLIRILMLRAVARECGTRARECANKAS